MPRPSSSFIHHRLESDLQDVGWYDAACTVMERSTETDAAGQEEEGLTELPLHVDIPCRVAALGSNDAERERAEITVEFATHIVKLLGHWPDITAAHVARINGTDYDIENVDWNSEKTFTRLTVQVLR